MSKAQECIYNANRHADPKFVLPFCVWMKENHFTLPPHVYIASHSMDEKTCSKCKCFKQAE